MTQLSLWQNRTFLISESMVSGPTKGTALPSATIHTAYAYLAASVEETLAGRLSQGSNGTLGKGRKTA